MLYFVHALLTHYIYTSKSFYNSTSCVCNCIYSPFFVILWACLCFIHTIKNFYNSTNCMYIRIYSLFYVMLWACLCFPLIIKKFLQLNQLHIQLYTFTLNLVHVYALQIFFIEYSRFPLNRLKWDRGQAS